MGNPIVDLLEYFKKEFENEGLLLVDAEIDYELGYLNLLPLVYFFKNFKKKFLKKLIKGEAKDEAVQDSELVGHEDGLELGFLGEAVEYGEEQADLLTFPGN